MMKKLLITYGIGFFFMMPISMLVYHKIISAEADYDEMVEADNGEYYEPENKPNILSTMCFMSLSSFLWPFTTVVLPGICFFNWIAKKFPDLMGYMFKDPDETEDSINKNEDEYL